MLGRAEVLDRRRRAGDATRRHDATPHPNLGAKRARQIRRGRSRGRDSTGENRLRAYREPILPTKIAFAPIAGPNVGGTMAHSIRESRRDPTLAIGELRALLQHVAPPAFFDKAARCQRIERFRSLFAKRQGRRSMAFGSRSMTADGSCEKSGFRVERARREGCRTKRVDRVGRRPPFRTGTWRREPPA
jgi:hypothetical protein